MFAIVARCNRDQLTALNGLYVIDWSTTKMCNFWFHDISFRLKLNSWMDNLEAGTVNIKLLIMAARHSRWRTYSLFTPPSRTRQDDRVLSVSAVWISYYIGFNPTVHCEPKKHTKMFLIYSLQNVNDCNKIWYMSSWVNLSYRNANVLRLTWIMSLPYLVKLSIHVLQANNR